MTTYEYQRWICRQAKEHGWQGIEPSVLGGYYADVTIKNAERFVAELPESCRAIINCFRGSQP